MHYIERHFSLLSIFPIVFMIARQALQEELVAYTVMAATSRHENGIN